MLSLPSFVFLAVFPCVFSLPFQSLKLVRRSQQTTSSTSVSCSLGAFFLFPFFFGGGGGNGVLHSSMPSCPFCVRSLTKLHGAARLAAAVQPPVEVPVATTPAEAKEFGSEWLRAAKTQQARRCLSLHCLSLAILDLPLRQ